MSAKPLPLSAPACPAKASTGIAGLDEMTGGGLPAGRTTLLVGGAGSGKTILALEFLVHGARDSAEPGIFVAFEETSPRIVANAASFGWDIPALQNRQMFFVDAQPPADLIQSGDFDLAGMLAVLDAQIAAMGARRIVFDALDVVLGLLPDTSAKRREIYRLHDWLLARQLTGLLTLKSGDDDAGTSLPQPFGFMQFMVDCAVILSHNVVLGVSQRGLRILKYRGSGFDENEAPFLISQSGFQVEVARTLSRADVPISNERVSSGVQRLDTMLGGGYFRGASVLITGFSGTAKTTLAGAFVEAACRRGEPAMFVSFDSDGSEVVRNLASVGIQLAPHVASGLLRMISARAITGSAETYLARIKTLAEEHGARCLVIDPMSAWSRSGSDLNAHSVAERLIDWSKASGITLLCTRLLDEMSSLTEDSAPVQISTLVDTWLHLNYLVQAGERNRGLSIIKSRGTAHSNQVRELILSNIGVTLADTYTAGGEVLMGTLRWEKERAEATAREASQVALKLKRVGLDAQEAELAAHIQSLQVELRAKQLEKTVLTNAAASHAEELSNSRAHMDELRGADALSVGAEPGAS